MTHLIVIRVDQTFSYQMLQKAAMDVLSDFKTGGSRLLPYGLVPPTGLSEDFTFSAYGWKDWVIALPTEENIQKPENFSIGRRLTRRQFDVLCCLSEGMTGKQIANRLNIHTRSVSLHISALKRNLDANTTAECVQIAARLGILKTGG
jgi:DNA-binding CsgD family transcriptional regulator